MDVRHKISAAEQWYVELHPKEVCLDLTPPQVPPLVLPLLPGQRVPFPHLCSEEAEQGNWCLR